MIWPKDSLVLGWSRQKKPWCQGWISTKESFCQITPQNFKGHFPKIKKNTKESFVQTTAEMEFTFIEKLYNLVSNMLLHCWDCSGWRRNRLVSGITSSSSTPSSWPRSGLSNDEWAELFCDAPSPVTIKCVTTNQLIVFHSIEVSIFSKHTNPSEFHRIFLCQMVSNVLILVL